MVASLCKITLESQILYSLSEDNTHLIWLGTAFINAQFHHALGCPAVTAPSHRLLSSLGFKPWHLLSSPSYLICCCEFWGLIYFLASDHQCLVPLPPHAIPLTHFVLLQPKLWHCPWYSPFCCWSHGNGSHTLSPQCLRSQMWQIQTLKKKGEGEGSSWQLHCLLPGVGTCRAGVGQGSQWCFSRALQPYLRLLHNS